jgi:3',5'-cyclic AMP phosphodiesterase CpdA
MSPKTRVFQIDRSSKHYTHLNFKNDPDEFQFVVISDNAGGTRPGVFTKAVEMANLLQPEFVVHVGDLIEGYNDDEDQIREWWQEIDEILEQLKVPFFFLPGNHDFYSDASTKAWGKRFGDERGYYHFVYKDVLFLMVNTEDPPKSLVNIQRDNPEMYQRILHNFQSLQEAAAKGDLTVDDAHLVDELADWVGNINISDAQVAYFKEVLEANPDVRWTFCFMHAPPYFVLMTGEKDPGNFSKIESMMADRPYTVFSAHTHVYDYEERNDRDYITTSTSGGISFTRPGAMDHIVWITMDHEGPKIVNLLLNGLMDKKGPPKNDALEQIGLYRLKE